MTKQEATKQIAVWKKEEAIFLEENDGFFLKIFLPLPYIEKIDAYLLKDNTFFGDLLVDAEYAFIYENNYLEVVPVDEIDEKTATKIVEDFYINSPYRPKKDYFEVCIGTTVEELNALYTLLLKERERQNNPSFSIDDLYMAFLDSYDRVDHRIIQSLQEEAYDEIEEDVRKKN